MNTVKSINFTYSFTFHSKTFLLFQIPHYYITHSQTFQILHTFINFHYISTNFKTSTPNSQLISIFSPKKFVQLFSLYPSSQNTINWSLVLSPPTKKRETLFHTQHNILFSDEEKKTRTRKTVGKRSLQYFHWKT